MASKEDTTNEEDWTHTEQQKAARNNLMGLVGTVNEVKVKMADNIEKALERETKLVELQKHAEQISGDAAQLANKMERISPKEDTKKE